MITKDVQQTEFLLVTVQELISDNKFSWNICVSPPVSIGRPIIFPLASVCGSVCPSQNRLLYNLITVIDISTKLHTFVKHIKTTCHAQEP